MELNNLIVLETKMRSAVEAYDEISKMSSSSFNSTYFPELEKEIADKLMGVFNLVGSFKEQLDTEYGNQGLNREVSPGLRAFYAIQNQIKNPEEPRESYNNGFMELYKEFDQDDSIRNFYDNINIGQRYSLDELSSEKEYHDTEEPKFYGTNDEEPKRTYKPSSFDTLEKDTFSMNSLLGGGRHHL